MQPPSRFIRRYAPALALAIAAFAGAACSAERVTSPDAAAATPRNGLFSDLFGIVTKISASALTRTTPLYTPVVASFNVTSAGGHYSVPGTGLRIDVPPMAVSAPLKLTVFAVPGPIVAYEFGPSGTKFKRPLRMTQDLRGTNWLTQNPANLEAGYFAKLTDVNTLLGQVLVSEFLNAQVDSATAQLGFDVSHFSGYMISTGRQQQQDQE
jgi:hypothetical protein